MSFPLPDSARAWQDKIRKFVDEALIPHEVEAELNGGDLPEAVRAAHHKARQAGPEEPHEDQQ